MARTAELRETRHLFILFFLFTAIVLLGTFTSLHKRQVREFREQVARDEGRNTSLLEGLVNRRFDDVVSDLLVLSSLACFLDYVDELVGPEDSQRNFLTFANTKARYDQIRFLDDQGMERIRVNWSSSGGYVVPDDDLQDKSDRYYFHEAVRLPAGGLYVSPLDLNMEQGAVQHPNKPVIRFVAPIHRSGVFKGVLVFNYLAAPLLADIEAQGEILRSDLMLVNEESYYLIGLEDDDEWGFMFPSALNRRFDEDYPDIWDSIVDSRGESLSLNHSDGIWTTQVVRPVSRYRFDNDFYQWTIISWVQEEQLAGAMRFLRTRFISLSSALILFAILPSWLLALFVVRSRARRRQLIHSASYDALTDLPNRVLLEDRLGQLLREQSRRHSDAAVLFLDLDGFKSVNDRFGHKAGDEVLVEVGRRLMTTLRRSDTAARFGGDEFVVLLSHVNDEADVELVARKLIARISEPFATQAGSVDWVGVSIGIRSLPPGLYLDSQDVLRQADNAMYEAKHAGKGTYAFHRWDT